MKTIEILEKLVSVPGVSGFEDAVGDEFLSLIAPFADECKKGVKTAVARKKGKGKKLLIEAHSDEVGLMITEAEGGFLRFRPVGGVDCKILPGALVYVNGLPGVIGAKPPHLQEKDEDRALKCENMAIDTGLSDATGLIAPGDVAVFSSPFLKMGGFVSARCLDNRACLAAVVRAAEMISSSPYDIYFAATGGEEKGMRGAKALGFCPDISLSLDVTFASHTGSEIGTFPIERPTLCMSPSLSRDLTDHLSECADEAGAPVTTEVAGGSSGTNAWAIASSCPNAKTALISVPVKYMHSTLEVADINCIDSAAKIIAEFAERGDF